MGGKGGKGSHRTCEICGLKERRKSGDSSFFQFPLDENRCKSWLRAAGNEELVHVPIEKLHQLRHVCSNHFQRKDFNKNGNRLKKRAIPILNLSAATLSDSQLIGFPQHMWKDRNEQTPTEKPTQSQENVGTNRKLEENTVTPEPAVSNQDPLQLSEGTHGDDDQETYLDNSQVDDNYVVDAKSQVDDNYVGDANYQVDDNYVGDANYQVDDNYVGDANYQVDDNYVGDAKYQVDDNYVGDANYQVDDKYVGDADVKNQDDKMAVEFLEDEEALKVQDAKDELRTSETSTTCSKMSHHRVAEQSEPDIKVCRACLNPRAPLFPLPGLPWSKTLLPYTIGPRPKWLCKDCAKEMRDAASFMERARRAEAAMVQVARGGELTMEDVLKIDRQKHRLTSRLVYEYDINGKLKFQEALRDAEVDYVLAEINVNKREDNEVGSDAMESNATERDAMEDYSRDECQWSDVTEDKFDAMNDILQETGVKVEDLTETKKVSSKTNNTKRDKSKDTSCTEQELSPFLVFSNKDKKLTKLAKSSEDKQKQIELQNKMDEYFNVTVYNTLEEKVAELQRRKDNPNYVNAPLKCEMCYQGFLDNVTYELHMHKHTENCGAFSCAVCQYRCASKERLRQHNFRHSRKFSCKLCRFESQDKYRATLHMRFHEGETYKCKHCDKVFNHIVNLHNHIRAKHPSDNVCPLCGYSFIGDRGLATHRALTHGHEHRPIPEDGPSCDECGVKFATDAALRTHTSVSPRHGRTHDNFKKRNYHELHRTLRASGTPAKERARPIVRRSGAVRTDKREITLTKFSEPVPCEKCGVPISSASEYHHHFKREHAHEKRTWYPARTHSRLCALCGKMLRTSMYNDHMLEHEGVMFKCPTCHKQFKRKINMILHSRVHLGERFPCSKCGKLFSHMGNRDRHEQYVHTESKDFKCPHCEKCFKNSGALKLHVDHVHLRKPYKRRNRQRDARRGAMDVAASKGADLTALCPDESVILWE